MKDVMAGTTVACRLGMAKESVVLETHGRKQPSWASEQGEEADIILS